jgi:hypothetical protein
VLQSLSYFSETSSNGPTMPSGPIDPVTDGILVDIDDTASTPQRITFCQGLHRDSVIWFLRTNTKVCPALAHQKCALTHGAQQSRNAAIGSTTDQMSAKAALAVMCALRVRTVACGELHGALLMRTVCRASGVYNERPRLSLVHVHPRYRATPPTQALSNSRVVLDGSAEALRQNEDVKEFYLGLGETGHRSYRDVKHYQHRKRWLA